MDKLFVEMYSDYGKYINQFRSFPFIIDGCKLVERRVLLSTYEVAREKLQKSNKIVGHCLGSYHPHGDCYQTLVGLVQNGFLDNTQGNWGGQIGTNDEPSAAMRYTETRLLRETYNLAFEYINYIDRETIEFYEEPPIIPTQLPICLLGKENTQGIGFGYRTYIPVYEKKDLIKRLEWQLGYTKKEPVIKPLSKCDIIATDAELKQILTIGKGQLTYKGKYEVDGNSVIIKSWPPTKQWSSIEAKLEKDVLVDKALGITDESSKKNGTRIRLTIRRQRGYPVTKLAEKVDALLTGKVTFECHMCGLDGKVALVSPDRMLMTTYDMYKKIINLVLQSQINDLQKTISELNIIRDMRPVLSVKLKEDPDNIDGAIDKISSVLKVDRELVKDVFEKYRIGRLFRIKTETGDLLKKKIELQKYLSDLQNYIWKEKYCK